MYADTYSYLQKIISSHSAFERSNQSKLLARTNIINASQKAGLAKVANNSFASRAVIAYALNWLWC